MGDQERMEERERMDSSGRAEKQERMEETEYTEDRDYMEDAEYGEGPEYKVRLEQFEGPLDLLLFLIKKEEIDIYDIPIAAITEQYLGYIGVLEFLDLGLAGEFLVMAATLMRIKARMLLPRESADEEEIDDPRRDLVHQLLEYQKFKQAASDFEAMEYQRTMLFTRPELDWEGAEPPEEMDYNLFDLMMALKQVLDRAEERPMEIAVEEVSIEEKMDYLRERVQPGKRVPFADLFEPGADRIEIIVTFLALLELLKLGILRFRQTKSFGTIHIYRKKQKAKKAQEAAKAQEKPDGGAEEDN
jgi:segregation and condensation protein A